MDFKNRIAELKERSRIKNIYTFTDFLSPTEQSEAGKDNVLFWGGHELSERRKACFGSIEEFGYEPDFGIVLLKITPSGAKFQEPITHRDILGAVLNLGVERAKTGDIFTSEKQSFIFVDEKMAELIKNELKRVGRAVVTVEEAESLPDELRPVIEDKKVSVASPRADSIVGAAYNLSREKSSELFLKSRVTVNGKEFPDGSKKLKANDVTAVRGFGKFIFYEECGESRKGKLYVRLGVYK